MNKLSSKQRKLVYFGCIIILLIPIIGLGGPATDKDETGGLLAQKRKKYELGESTLGQVDPSSAAMNLVLLGLRGPAVTVLWLNAKDEKATKNWSKLRSTVDSIVQLQPHYKKIWRFQGWNLAYNVSSEWDAVEDRYFWVKEGAKFTMKGVDRNVKYSELPWDVARILGAKVGNADERVHFRKFFLKDPDVEKFPNGPDPMINPKGEDNYLVAREWYTRANTKETANGQEIQMRSLFRSYPAKSLQDYARALQREGKFGEATREAWQRAFDSWTGEYGQEEYDCEPLIEISGAEPPQGILKLECTAADYDQLSESNKVPREAQKYWTDRYQKVSHYIYWRIRCLAEKEQLMVEAHRDLYDGRKLFREGATNATGENGDEPSPSLKKITSGLEKLAVVFKQYPTFQYEDSSLDEAMLGLYYFRRIHELNDKEIPANYPLKDMWEENQEMLMDVRMEFARENAGYQ